MLRAANHRTEILTRLRTKLAEGRVVVGAGAGTGLSARCEEEGGVDPPCVFNADDARAMTEVGADIIVAHMGLTTGGSIGARTAKTLDACVEEVQAIVDAAKAVNDAVLVLCHGGPIASPADAQFMLDRCPDLDGFYGASSMERLPTERALTAEVTRFASLTLGARRGRGPAAREAVERESRVSRA